MKQSNFGIIGGFVTLIGAFILIFLIGPAPQYTLMFTPHLGYSFLVGLIFSVIGIASYWVERINSFMLIFGISLIISVFLTNTPIAAAPFYIVGGILYLMAAKKSKDKPETGKRQ